MIFLLSEKIWEKRKKKLVEPKDYIIVDSLDAATESPLLEYTNAVTIDDFAMPTKLMHAFQDDFEEILDDDAIIEIQKNFFYGTKFRSSVLAVVRTFIEKDLNIFIVIKNKAYKGWRKMYQKAFEKAVPEFKDYFWILSKDLNDKDQEALKRNIPPEKIPYLKKKVAEKETEMEVEHEKAKKKHKKNKKKAKKHGLGILED